jgi:phosphoenolpyruvate synthase/pyruvate phosphate dikinase
MFRDHEIAFLLPLADQHATLQRVGGKGASLARLARGGFSVPAGVHITTAAYRCFVAANHLHRLLRATTAAGCADDLAVCERAASTIAAAFAAGTMPDVLARAIEQAYAQLGANAVLLAVRSSATLEDLPTRSFAGQQATYLNIGGADLLEAITRCWASLWTARAISYRAQAGIHTGEISIAVVVQQLIAADVAGVLFTANPITGARHQVMMNASWGLGEAIVGGLVTPDSLIVDKTTGRIVVQEIADKAVMTVRTASGTHEVPVPPRQRRQPVLAPAQAAELAQLGLAIEQLYGQPMDIEWAMHDGRIFVVQARPITVLPAP